MNIEEKIQDVEERIKHNKEALERLNKMIIKACSPKGLSSGTSYEDYDTIRGSRKEIDLFKFAEDKKILEIFIEIDECILEELKMNKYITESIKDIKGNYDRVVYLKKIGYSTKEIADKLNISDRHVRRIVKKYKMSV